MKTTNQQPVAIACLFIWIGFIGAISFMEAWLKFRAPGVTASIGLGIGRLVFNALNKVEWVFTIVVCISAYRYSKSLFSISNIALLTIIVIIILQTSWLLPALNARATLHIQNKIVPPSYLHFWFISMEILKVVGLFITAVSLLYNYKYQVKYC